METAGAPDRRHSAQRHSQRHDKAIQRFHHPFDDSDRMPRSAQRQPNDWNSFQRHNRGRWDRDELKRQWHIHKQRSDQQDQQQHVGANSSSSSSSSKAQQLDGLKQSIKALIHSTSSSSAHVRKQQQDNHPADADQPQQDSPSADACATSADACAADGNAALSSCPHSPRRSQADASLVVTGPSEHNVLSSTPTPPTQQVVQQRQDGLDSCAAARSPDAPATTAAEHAVADSPDSCPGAPSPTGVNAQQLHSLRAALHHLLAQQGSAQQPHQQQQPAAQPQQQHLSGSSSHAVAASTGCFGGVGLGSRLSWNAFQRACKGRGLSKPEMSAAYQHIKQHYLATGQLLDVEAYLQQHHPQQQQQQQQQHDHHREQPGSRWSTLQHWVHSRVGSRAASRAASTAVSPSSSPSSKQQRHRQQLGQPQSHAEDQQPGVAGVSGWAAFKQWCHSRSSSRATSRLGTPAASPGQKHQLPTCPEVQQPQQQQPEQLHQPGQDADDGDTSYLPFAQQPQPVMQQQHGQVQQQLCHSQACPRRPVQQLEQVEPGEQQDQLHKPSSQSAILHSASGLPGAEVGWQGAAGAGADLPDSSSAVGRRLGSSAMPVVAAWAAVVSPSTAPAAPPPAASAAAALTPSGGLPLPRIGHMLLREAVPDALLCRLLPGGLSELGFSQWVAVERQQLRGLKRLLPRQPGLYEWGVRLPRGITTSSSSSRGQAAAGSNAAGVQHHDGPVLAFYLGKAGTLKPQRPRRSGSSYGASGETLRSRLGTYWAARSGRLGPAGEPHKQAFFQHQLQAGGRLHLRWRVCTDIEPVEAETYLLNRVDYAVNFMNNRGRRPLMVLEIA